MNKYIIYLVILGIGGAFGFYMAPEKIKKEIQIKEIEIEKEVIKEVEVNKRRKSTHTIITEFPDGKKIIEIFEVDESIKVVEVEKEKIIYKDKIKNIKKETIKQKSQWYAKISISVYPTQEVYQVDLNKRILGPIFLGVNGNTKNEFGVGVGLEF